MIKTKTKRRQDVLVATLYLLTPPFFLPSLSVLVGGNNMYDDRWADDGWLFVGCTGDGLSTINGEVPCSRLSLSLFLYL